MKISLRKYALLFCLSGTLPLSAMKAGDTKVTSLVDEAPDQRADPYYQSVTRAWIPFFRTLFEAAATVYMNTAEVEQMKSQITGSNNQKSLTEAFEKSATDSDAERQHFLDLRLFFEGQLQAVREVDEEKIIQAHCANSKVKAQAVRQMRRTVEMQISEPLLCETPQEFRLYNTPTPAVDFASLNAVKLYQGDLETDYHYVAGVTCGSLMLASYKAYVDNETMKLGALRKRLSEILGQHLVERQFSKSEELTFYRGLSASYGTADIWAMLSGGRARTLVPVHGVAAHLLKKVLYVSKEADRELLKAKVLNVLTKLDESPVFRRALTNKQEIDYFAEGKVQGATHIEMIRAFAEGDSDGFLRLHAHAVTSPVLMELETKLDTQNPRTEPELLHKLQLFNKGKLYVLQGFCLNLLISTHRLEPNGVLGQTLKNLYEAYLIFTQRQLACTSYKQIQNIYKELLQKQTEALPDIKIDQNYQCPLFANVETMKVMASYQAGMAGGKSLVKAYGNSLRETSNEADVVIVTALAGIIRSESEITNKDEKRLFVKGWSDCLQETSLDMLLAEGKTKQKKDKIREAFTTLAAVLKTATHAESSDDFAMYLAKYMPEALMCVGGDSADQKSAWGRYCLVS